MKFASVYQFAEQLRRDGHFPHDLAFTVFRTHPNAGTLPTRILVVCINNTITVYTACPCTYDDNITGWKYHKAWTKQVFDKNIPPWIVNAVCYSYCTGYAYLKSSPEQGVVGFG